MREINCGRCGKKIVSDHIRRKYCKDCAPVAKRENYKQAQRRYKEERRTVRHCIACGQEIIRGDMGRKYCRACRGNIGQTPGSGEQGKTLRYKERGGWDLTGKSAERVDVEARALNMTYGAYSSAVKTGWIEARLHERGIYDGLKRIEEAWRAHLEEKRVREEKERERLKSYWNLCGREEDG